MSVPPGVPSPRAHGISEQSLYRWKVKHGGEDVGDAMRLRQLEAENRRLKRLVAELSLDRHRTARAPRWRGWGDLTPAEAGGPGGAGEW